MKRRDLERRLAALGWRLKRHGGRHGYWSNGEREEAVPRHNEIGELLARKIIKAAEAGRK